jgi:hypothetical protein
MSTPAPTKDVPSTHQIEVAAAPKNRTNCIVTLDFPVAEVPQTTSNGRQVSAVAAAAIANAYVAEPWSAYYKEQEDTFDEFTDFDPNHKTAEDAPAGRAAGSSSVLKRNNTGSFSGRHLSSRLLSGQFENEVARSWEEDWDDEDPDDTFDAIMAKVARQNIAAMGQKVTSA